MSFDNNQIELLKQRGYLSIDQNGINHIDQFIDTLLEKRSNGFGSNKKYYGVFKGHLFRSDDPQLSVDMIYKTITGMTKQQCVIERQRWIEQYNKRYEENKKNIKAVIQNWVDRGHKIIYEKYWNNWDTAVSYRAGSVYIGEELNNVLDILEGIKQGISFDQLFENFMKTYPDKERFLIVKKILWLVGGEQFVGYLNKRVQIPGENSEKSEKERMTFR